MEIKSITEILEEELQFKNYQELVEALITFGGKAYPKFGQVVILAGGAGCFVGETKVKTKNGEVFIKDIKVKDEVLSYNEITKKKEFKSVVNTFKYSNHELLKLMFDNGEVVECTPEHKFLINDVWIKAKDIVIENN
jgi:intein/homing endonuclease